MTIKYQGHEFKGTAGEWVARRNESYWEVNRVDGKGRWDGGIGEVCPSDPGNSDSGLQEANAKLFAAAPKLLQALIAAMDFIDASPCDPDITSEQCKAYARLQDANPVDAILEALGAK